MSQTIVRRTIHAPIESVFQTLADIENYSRAVPDIVGVEMLSEVTSGVGARFRETRLMKGREATAELTVTEYVENERIRLVSDEGGTLWDTVFTVKAEGDATDLNMVMDAKPYRFIAKLITPFMKGFLFKALEKDMDAVKTYCEE